MMDPEIHMERANRFIHTEDRYTYSMMQSDRNSSKVETFREAISTELNFENSFSSVFVSRRSYYLFVQNLLKRVVHKL